MNINTRYSIAIHTLTLLALERDGPLTSEYIADSVRTNPVVIRRILGYLRVQKIVESQPGMNGGWKLIREPETITLREVYRAVEAGQGLAIHRQPNPQCPVGGNIQGTLEGIFVIAQTAMEESLTQTTIADVLQDVLRHAEA